MPDPQSAPAATPEQSDLRPVVVNALGRSVDAASWWESVRNQLDIPIADLVDGFDAIAETVIGIRTNIVGRKASPLWRATQKSRAMPVPCVGSDSRGTRWETGAARNATLGAKTACPRSA